MQIQKRKILLIDPIFQLKFIGWMLGIAICVIFVFYAAHLRFFYLYVNKGLQAELPENIQKAFFSFLADQYFEMNIIFAVTSILAIFIIATIGLILSHRIAGPIQRICNHMNDSSENKDLKEVQFRPDDYFKDLERAYNQHLMAIREKIEKNEKTDKQNISPNKSEG